MDDARMVVIPAGQYLTVSTGEYSDYYIRGVFRALKDIDAEALRDEWLSEHQGQRVGYKFDDGAFLGWVSGKGLLEPIASFEWHLCDYSTADEMAVEAPSDGDLPDAAGDERL